MSNVIWEPIPGSSQELVLDTRADHTLYYGTRGAAKTACQLMFFRKYVGLGYGKFLRGIVFDLEFKDLSDYVAQSKKFFLAFEDGCYFLESQSAYKWVWPTGEELLFRHACKLEDYKNFHGHEYPLIFFNELTKHGTSELYDKLMSTNRSSFVPEKNTPKDKNGNYLTLDKKPLPKMPLKVLSATNPSGPGHNWVKSRFIDCARTGQIHEKRFNVFDPKQKKEIEVIKTQIAIFGSYKENIYLDPAYIAELMRLTENNKNLRKAWLEGSWDVTAGGAIDDLWEHDIHVIQRFVIPKNWYIDRTFDNGSFHPFSVCWFAEANGEEVILENGEVFCPEAGSIIQFAEWYGTEEIGTNRGLRISVSEIAEGIKQIEISLMNQKWILKQPKPGPADNKIREVVDKDLETIEKLMADRGIKWTNSDKSKGSRVNGLALFREMLFNSKRKSGPGFYVMQNCISTIKTVPILPRDSKNIEDVDTKSEDHIWDAIRYKILQGKDRLAEYLKIKMPT
jgi:hypothetical protein